MFQGILLRCILMNKKLNSLFASLTALYPTLKSMGFTAISITTGSEMVTGIWVLGDQLWTGQAALSSCEKAKKQTPVILIESPNYARARPYHRQKLVLISILLD